MRTHTRTTRADNATRRAELLARYNESGDLDARGELVEEMMGLVRHIASRYANRGVPLDDLVQVGAVGLIKAVDRFEPAQGVQLSTFAAPNIAGEIKRYFRDRSWAIRVPRDIQELDAKINQSVEKLTAQLHRAPTVAEIATAVKATEEQVLTAMEGGRSYTAVSLEEPAAEDRTKIDTIPSQERGFVHAEQRMLIDDSLTCLPAREQEIVRLRFYEELTQREIADRLGISQMHVSRLLARSLAELREQMDDSGPSLLGTPAER